MRYPRRPVTNEDKDWLFELHRKALGPYIERIFGWDEQVQRRFFDERFGADGSYVILSGGRRIGVVRYFEQAEKFYIENIEILPSHQRQGIGGAVLGEILDEADRARKEVELQVFKISPARRLYQRLGFEVFEETKTHYRLRRAHP